MSAIVGTLPVVNSLAVRRLLTKPDAPSMRLRKSDIIAGSGATGPKALITAGKVPAPWGVPSWVLDVLILRPLGRRFLFVRSEPVEAAFPELVEVLSGLGCLARVHRRLSRAG